MKTLIAIIFCALSTVAMAQQTETTEAPVVENDSITVSYDIDPIFLETIKNKYQQIERARQTQEYLQTMGIYNGVVGYWGTQKAMDLLNNNPWLPQAGINTYGSEYDRLQE